jgi:nickel transport protein
MKKLLLLPGLACMGVVLHAVAHDAWVEPGIGPIYTILAGHRSSEEYPSAKVTSLQALDFRQRTLPLRRIASPQGMSVSVAGQPVLFLLEFNNSGLWTRIGNHWQEVGPTANPRPMRQLAAHEQRVISKTLLSWTTWMSRPMGQPLELVPATTETLPVAGRGLRLRLLLNGRPLSGQMLSVSGSADGPKTDAAGNVTVTIARGTNRFSAHLVRHSSGKEPLDLTAVLAFVGR